MNRSQLKAKHRRREEREEWISQEHPHITRLFLASQQAIIRHAKAEGHRFDRTRPSRKEILT